MEAESDLRFRRRPPWYRRWWVWTLLVGLLLILLLLLGHRTRVGNREDDGILYRLLHRVGGDRTPRPE